MEEIIQMISENTLDCCCIYHDRIHNRNNKSHEKYFYENKILILDFLKFRREKNIKLIVHWDFLFLNDLWKENEISFPFVFLLDPIFIGWTKISQKLFNQNVLHVYMSNICRDHQKGRCKRKQDCPYLHMCKDIYQRLNTHLCSFNVALLYNNIILKKYNLSHNFFDYICNDLAFISSLTSNSFSTKEIQITMLDEMITMLIDIIV